jgi:phosphonate transport system permease protein
VTGRERIAAAALVVIGAAALPAVAVADEPMVPLSEALATRGYDACALAEWLPDAALPTPRRVTLALSPVEGSVAAEAKVAPAERYRAFLAREFARRYADAYGGLDALTARVTFEVIEAADYDAILNAMRSRQVQLAWMGATLYARAAGEVGAQPLLTAVRFGRPYYYAALIAHRSAGVTDLCDLRGRSVAWVSPTSGAGYLFPRMGIATHECDGAPIGDVDAFFGESLRAGEHLAVVTAVGQKTADVGATWSNPPGHGTGAWTAFFGGQYAEQIDPVWISPPIPADGIVAARSFLQEEPRLAAQLACVLSRQHTDPDGAALMMQLFNTDRLVPADQAQYDEVRSLWCRTFGGPGCVEERDRSATPPPTFRNPTSVGVFVGLVGAMLLVALVLRPSTGRSRRVAFGLLLGASFVWACLETSFTPGNLWAGFTRDATGASDGGPNGIPDLLDQLWAMLHLDLSVAPQVFESTIETINTAIVATVIAGVISLPLGFLAASNVVGSAWARGVIRFGLNANRAVDTLIVAVVLVAAFRLGPLPGTLALAIHSVGNLAKLFYEAIETLDSGPVEAMEAVGARKLEVVRWGLWPQAIPHFISHFLYRFELNVRVAVVLGLVGGGGIGALLIDYKGRGDWGQVAVVVVTVMVLVMLLDFASSRLRRSLA